ncbi:alpha/beta hydrolase [Altererythrobacter aquiaggeris]|uniref:alpha/beta hydrolase n=1 Tax=Aestuarierythrobacter aquiaggeris TaxID=1898396 RepID=UPI0030159C69
MYGLKTGICAAALLVGGCATMQAQDRPVLPAKAVSGPITAIGPQGGLAGTLVAAEPGQPVVLIIPGSGPTDRDGNNPLGVAASSYRLLAEGLAARGIGSVRIDKRGMFGSAAAVPDANDVTIGDYATDVATWKTAIRSVTGAECVWLAGHSEGGLVALAAAQQPGNICGVILLASMGRPLGTILREQLSANPANGPLLPDAMAAITSLENGERVDVSAMHPALAGLFAPPIQGFLIDAMSRDPAALAAASDLPLLIIHGEADIQVALADARALHSARPDSKLVILPGVNHLLKTFEGETPAANLASYSNPDLPISPAVVGAVADFIFSVRAGD